MKLRYSYLALILAFLLGVRDGFVALWKIPGNEPLFVSPYSVSSLPAEDRKQLENGIIVRTEEELARLLEDYLS